MGLFDWLNKKVATETEVKVKKPRSPRKPKVVVVPEVKVSPAQVAKDAATAAGLPWVDVLGIEVDVDNISNGSFSLDWNDLFIAKLVRAGYKGKTDADMVDAWFTEICRSILAENYEQHVADPTNRNR